MFEYSIESALPSTNACCAYPITFETSGWSLANFERCSKSSLVVFSCGILPRTNHCLHVWKLFSASCLESLKVGVIRGMEKRAESTILLRQLEIRLCPRMKVLPDGLNHVNSLLELKLTNMSMEINTEKHNIPRNCEVHIDDSVQ